MISMHRDESIDTRGKQRIWKLPIIDVYGNLVDFLSVHQNPVSAFGNFLGISLLVAILKRFLVGHFLHHILIQPQKLKSVLQKSIRWQVNFTNGHNQTCVKLAYMETSPKHRFFALWYAAAIFTTPAVFRRKIRTFGPQNDRNWPKKTENQP